jgi:hypothetical protein
MEHQIWQEQHAEHTLSLGRYLTNHVVPASKKPPDPPEITPSIADHTRIPPDLTLVYSPRLSISCFLPALSHFLPSHLHLITILSLKKLQIILVRALMVPRDAHGRNSKPRPATHARTLRLLIAMLCPSTQPIRHFDGHS